MADETNEGTFLRQLRETSLESATQQLRLLFELKGRPGAPATAPPGSGAGGTGAVPAQPSDLLFDLARLSLGYYDQFLRLTSRHFDTLVDAVRRPGELMGTTPPRLALAASVAHGGHATARFLVENPHPVAADVFFTPPVLHAVQGGTQLAGTSAIERADASGDLAFRLPARGSGVFQLVVDPTAEAAAGAYVGESMVLVGERVVGRLVIEVQVT